MSIEDQDLSHYDRHRVSCKIALFNADRTRILLNAYFNGTFGLPGGHIDGDETPDIALIRELKEEHGIDYDGPIDHKDFFRTKYGKIVLASVGELDERVELRGDEDEPHGAFWANVAAIRSGELSTGEYDEFIVRQL